MRSIRYFLIVILLATVTLVNFIAALHGYRASMSAIDSMMDSRLKEYAQLLATAHIVDNDRYKTRSDSAPYTQPNIASNMQLQVWRGNQLVKASLSSDQPITQPITGFHNTNVNGYRWRAYTLLSNEEDADLTLLIIVAERMDQRYSLAEAVTIESVFPIIIAIPILGLLIWFVVGRGLAPLAKLTLQLKRKQSDDLSPLSNEAPTRELIQLETTINDLLQRLNNTLEQEKRFSSNAAHELRTPISAMKVHLYNLSQDLVNEPDSLKQVRLGLDRLSYLVEQTLSLHRSSQSQTSVNRQCINLTQILQDAIGHHYDAMELKQQDVELIYPEKAELAIYGNQNAIETLVNNLLGNANKYCPPHGSIIITVEKSQLGGEDHIRMTFEDSGPGISDDEKDIVFERFYRSGGDRHASGEMGCGLGLYIVKQVADTHGATITISTSKQLGGLAISVTFDHALLCKNNAPDNQNDN